MKVLVTGGDGQLSRDLGKTLPPYEEDKEILPYRYSHEELDITNPEMVEGKSG